MIIFFFFFGIFITINLQNGLIPFFESKEKKKDFLKKIKVQNKIIETIKIK